MICQYLTISIIQKIGTSTVVVFPVLGFEGWSLVLIASVHGI